MASQARKHRGFRTERIVAQYLSTVWTGATVGRGSGKDIVNVPFDVEVKARSGFQPLAYIKQLKARTAISGELGFGVIRLNGQGEDAREYAAIIRLEDLLPLLVLKYGHLDNKPTEADIDRCTGCGSYMIRKCLTCQPTTIDVLSAISKMRSHMDGTIDH
jgi:NAD-dependent dihydropyrimidine dehydrogenase PreA subunit